MLAPVDRTVVSADGTVLSVSEAGAGPAVVVVGGAFDHRGTPYLDRVVQSLATDHRVVTYDRRGRGTSGDTAPWSIEREADDFRAVTESIVAPATRWGSASASAWSCTASRRAPPSTAPCSGNRRTAPVSTRTPRTSSSRTCSTSTSPAAVVVLPSVPSSPRSSTSRWGRSPDSASSRRCGGRCWPTRTCWPATSDAQRPGDPRTGARIRRRAGPRGVGHRLTELDGSGRTRRCRGDPGLRAPRGPRAGPRPDPDALHGLLAQVRTRPALTAAARRCPPLLAVARRRLAACERMGA